MEHSAAEYALVYEDHPEMDEDEATDLLDHAKAKLAEKRNEKRDPIEQQEEVVEPYAHSNFIAPREDFKPKYVAPVFEGREATLDERWSAWFKACDEARAE